MATERKWGKRGLTLTFSTDKRPVPKVRIPYPLPDFGTETSPLIQVLLETLDNVPGIRVTTISPEGLPKGFRGAQWSLQHTEFSGLVAPNTLTWESIPISAGPLSLFYSFPTANATHRFRVVQHTIAPGSVAEDTVYPFVAIVTPMDYRPPTWEEFLAAQSTANSAAAAASAAQSSANTANAALADIASDDKLTPVEKQRARLEWDTILGERAGIQGQADTFGVSRTAYDSAFQALANYLNADTAWSSGAPSWLSDANLGTTTTIVGSTFRANWKSLYDARQALLNAVAAKAKTLADGAQAAANSAAYAASAAQSSANSANAALADISSDGKITPVEKQRARLEWDTILAERSGIQAHADAFAVSRTAYDSAFQALATYLNNGTAWSSGTPSWLSDANLSTTTTIVGATFRSKWKDLYDERQALLNAISAKAKTLADGAQATANSAASAASAAQSSANTANAALADISSDGKLTPVEKQRARLEWDTILAERAGIQGQADTFGVSRTAYDAQFQALANYLNAGTTWSSGAPSWLSDANLGVTTNIVGADFRSNWQALYDARTALLNAVADKARQNAAAAQSTANSASSAASAAQSTANSAASAADYAEALARQSYNLIKNGNSEDANPTGYEAAGISTNTSYTGSKSTQVTFNTPGGWTRLAKTALLPASPGEQFYASAMVFNDAGNQGALMAYFYDAALAQVGLVDTQIVSATGGWFKTETRQSAPMTAPAGTVYVQFECRTYRADGNSGAGASYFDCLYACRKVAAGMIEADAVQTVHLDAYAVTAAKIATDAIKTSDYAEDAYGNPTAGAWMGVNTTQPVKCGPNGLQIGKGVFNQQSLITERIANGYFWQSAQGWGLSGTNAPVWSSENPHTTGSGNVATVNTGSVPSSDDGSVTTVGSASQVIQLGVPDPNATAQNLTLWLRSEYSFGGTGASFEGVSAYAKVYLTKLGAGGSETLIGTLNIASANTWTQGTFDLDSVYTAAGAYGLRIEISSTTFVLAGPTRASVTARARLADVKFTA